MVLDPARPIPERRLLHRSRTIAGAHRCFHRSIQRDSRAIRLDQEKGPSAAFQKSPYHSTLIPGTRSVARRFASDLLDVLDSGVGEGVGSRLSFSAWMASRQSRYSLAASRALLVLLPFTINA